MMHTGIPFPINESHTEFIGGTTATLQRFDEGPVSSVFPSTAQAMPFWTLLEISGQT
jgi:hypothetical protein